jgi:uncharacterized protein (TIGR03066 family)
MKSRLSRHRNKLARAPQQRPCQRVANGGLQVPGGQPAQPGPPGTGSRRKWIIVALVGLVAFVGIWAIFERVVWARVPSELVGKWVVTEGPQEGATFDFYRNGTMVGKVNAGGKEAIVGARVRVEDKMIYSTTRNPHTGEDDTTVLTIRTLTARELVVEDKQDQVMKMERAK